MFFWNNINPKFQRPFQKTYKQWLELGLGPDPDNTSVG